MFGFRKLSPLEKLEKKYKELLEESYKLSTSNRAKSDQVRAEAETIMSEIEKLKTQQK